MQDQHSLEAKRRECKWHIAIDLVWKYGRLSRRWHSVISHDERCHHHTMPIRPARKYLIQDQHSLEAKRRECKLHIAIDLVWKYGRISCRWHSVISHDERCHHHTMQILPTRNNLIQDQHALAAKRRECKLHIAIDQVWKYGRISRRWYCYLA